MLPQAVGIRRPPGWRRGRRVILEYLRILRDRTLISEGGWGRGPALRRAFLEKLSVFWRDVCEGGSDSGV